MFSIGMLFLISTHVHALPMGLLPAVCYVESAHSPSAMNYSDGGSTSIGICQIKLATARMLGYTGTSERLRSPDVNINYAGAYLNRQLKRYNNDITKAVAAFNAGTCRLNAKGRPMNSRYVTKVFHVWESRP